MTGTSRVRFDPLRPNSLCAATCTVTYRSPGSPPFSPGAPLPFSRMRCPSSTPAGMRTCIVFADFPRPEPPQSGQGSSTMRPRPRQSSHGSLSWKTPPDWVERMPEPSQVGQTRGSVPAFAPVPRHAAHGWSETVRSVIVVPSTACSNEMLASPSMLAPRRGPRPEARRVAAPPPNSPPKMSPRFCPAPPPWAPRNRSSNPPGCAPWRWPPGRPNGNPPPKRLRVSSYSLRFSGSLSTALASDASLKRASAFLSSGF